MYLKTCGKNDLRNARLFTFYKDKPVGSRFGQMVSKGRFPFNQDFRKFAC